MGRSSWGLQKDSSTLSVPQWGQRYESDRVARVSHMDVHSAKESGSQKMPGGRPRRQLFRPRARPDGIRNWPPNLLMITEREESAFFQPSRVHIRHQGRPRSQSRNQTNNQATNNSFAFGKCEAAQKKMVAMSRYPGWNLEPLSHPLLELEEFPFFHYWPSGVIRIGLPV